MSEPIEKLRATALELSHLRRRPCLILCTQMLNRCTVQAVHNLCRDRRGNLDVVIYGPGGCPEAAYLIARELHRRFSNITAFVPECAKSAATMVALSAHELVLGELGELGPLDTQFSKKQKADFPVDRSCLDRFKTLEQLHIYSRDTFNDLVSTVIENSGMSAEDGCRIGLDFTSRVCAPLYSQIDPDDLGESARALEIGLGYADRILRRYRPELYAENGPLVIQRLAREYPSHDFVIDREELEELGIPVRPPTAKEAAIVYTMALVLHGFDGEQDLIEMVDAESGPDNDLPNKTATQLTRNPSAARRRKT